MIHKTAPILAVCMNYEIDTHQYLTRFLAENLGFPNPIGIGLETQALDEDYRDAFLGYWNMSKYHFPSRSRLKHLARASGNSPRQMGEFLHPQEDTYAHCSGSGDRDWDYYGNLAVFPNGIPFGHLFYGHYPDHTWNDPQKAMMMARRVYADLKILQTRNYPNVALSIKDPPDPANDSSDLVWHTIVGKIKDFVDWPAKTFPDDPLETVTQQGYLDKIRTLYPGYTPDFKHTDRFLGGRGLGVRQFMGPPAHGAQGLLQSGIGMATLFLN